MPTYRLSGRNQFRTPSGAVGEAPDGPGGMAALSDDLDNFLGVGGAEYCANSAAVLAIPSSRLFPGKLAYRADNKIVYRYVGIGGTNLLGNDTTHNWQAIHQPPQTYTPTWTGLTLGSSTANAIAGISGGLFWTNVYMTFGSGFSLTAATELVMSGLPGGNALVGETVFGSGLYRPGGSSTDNAMIPVVPYAVAPTANSASGSVRIRSAVATGTDGTANHLRFLATVAGTGASGDTMALQLIGPSAGVL